MRLLTVLGCRIALLMITTLPPFPWSQARSGSVYSIKAEPFAFGGLVLSTSDRAITADMAQLVFFLHPRGPSLTSVRSALSLDVLLAQSLARGGGSTTLVKLCTLTADLSGAVEQLNGGVDLNVTNNYLTKQANAPGGAPGAAVGVCSVRKPPDSNGWYRVTLWLNPFTSWGWDMLQFRDSLGTGALFYRELSAPRIASAQSPVCSAAAPPPAATATSWLLLLLQMPCVGDTTKNAGASWWKRRRSSLLSHSSSSRLLLVLCIPLFRPQWTTWCSSRSPTCLRRRQSRRSGSATPRAAAS